MSPEPTTDGGGIDAAGSASAVDVESTGARTSGSVTDERIRPAVWLNQVRAFAERCLREVANSWVLLTTVVALPAGLQLLYGLLWEGFSATMIASAAIGTASLGAMYVSLYIFGYLLAGDLEARRYEAYRSMPVSPLADLSGRMLAGAVLAAVAFSLTLVAGVATGASFGLRSVTSIPIVALAFVLTCVIWMLLALPIVAAAENERVAEYGVPMIAMLAYMGTGFNGALTELAPVGGDVLNYLPNTLPTRLIVYHLVPTGDWAAAGVAPPAMPTGPEYVALLVAYAAVALGVGAALTNGVLYERGWWP